MLGPRKTIIVSKYGRLYFFGCQQPLVTPSADRGHTGFDAEFPLESFKTAARAVSLQRDLQLTNSIRDEHSGADVGEILWLYKRKDNTQCVVGFISLSTEAGKQVARRIRTGQQSGLSLGSVIDKDVKGPVVPIKSRVLDHTGVVKTPAYGMDITSIQEYSEDWGDFIQRFQIRERANVDWMHDRDQDLLDRCYKEAVGGNLPKFCSSEDKHYIAQQTGIDPDHLSAFHPTRNSTSTILVASRGSTPRMASPGSIPPTTSGAPQTGTAPPASTDKMIAPAPEAQTIAGAQAAKQPGTVEPTGAAESDKMAVDKTAVDNDEVDPVKGLKRAISERDATDILALSEQVLRQNIVLKEQLESTKEMTSAYNALKAEQAQREEAEKKAKYADDSLAKYKIDKGSPVYVKFREELIANGEKIPNDVFHALITEHYASQNTTTSLAASQSAMDTKQAQHAMNEEKRKFAQTLSNIKNSLDYLQSNIGMETSTVSTRTIASTARTIPPASPPAASTALNASAANEPSAKPNAMKEFFDGFNARRAQTDNKTASMMIDAIYSPGNPRIQGFDIYKK